MKTEKILYIEKIMKAELKGPKRSHGNELDESESWDRKDIAMK